MFFGSYLFTGIFNDDAILPEYKGSTFRGVFGHALKRVVCALRREDCESCLLRPQCVYVFLFETLPQNHRNGASSPSPLHPYIIEPEIGKQTHFEKGSPFTFNLLLFGRANDYLPYFIYAFDQIGRSGIGKRIDGKRPSFTLSSVSAMGQPVYSRETGKIAPGEFTENIGAMLDGPVPDADADRLSIHLLTPLRIKYENHLEAKLPFHILIRGALRRISTLCASFGDGEPDLDYRGLVERAHRVGFGADNLHWFDWKRYSNRQDQSMLMGGIVGSATYEGNLSEYIPLMRFCEKVHLGKQTTFGLGKINIESSPP